MKSPEGKVTYAGGEDSNIINLRSTPKKDEPELPTTIMETIEGVSGEVPKTSVLSDGEEDRLLTYDDEEELKKGESGMSSSEGEPETQDFKLEAVKEPAKTLDLEGVGVTEQSELHLISKSSRTAEPFESEL